MEAYLTTEEVTLRRGESYLWALNVSMKELTSPLTVDLQMPKDGIEPFLTIWNVSYSHIGRNYPCKRILKQQLNVTFGSSFSTSQMDSAHIDMGIVNDMGRYFERKRVQLITNPIS